MKGRLRRAWIRWARRMGRMERVKFAEEKSFSAVRGGRPCLSSVRMNHGAQLDTG